MPASPPLNALQAFESAARHLSFTKAADELFVTPGAISQHIRRLERQVGAPLFHRTGNRLFLTERGEAVTEHLTLGFRSIAAGVRVLFEPLEKREVTVSVTPSFGSCWLLPRIDDFRHAEPDIALKIDASRHHADFLLDGVDIAIRHGSGRYSGVQVEMLMHDFAIPVCSPGFLEKHGPFDEPAALAGLPLVHVDWGDQAAAAPTWSKWAQQHHLPVASFQQGVSVTVEEMGVRMALGGSALALISRVFVGDDLAAGRLVRALPKRFDVDTEFDHYIVRPEAHIRGRQKDETIEKFVAWLKSESAMTDEIWQTMDTAGRNST